MKRLLSNLFLREFDKRYVSRKEFAELAGVVADLAALLVEHEVELEEVGNELGHKHLMNYIANYNSMN